MKYKKNICIWGAGLRGKFMSPDESFEMYYEGMKPEFVIASLDERNAMYESAEYRINYQNSKERRIVNDFI
jgi:hypothetical protein